MRFLPVISLALFCSCATAPPRVGYVVRCYPKDGYSYTCDLSGTEKAACDTKAPTGYYWELFEEPGKEYCSFKLRRLVPESYPSHDTKTNSTAGNEPGCKSDAECKGKRICEKGSCQYPRSTTDKNGCISDKDCPDLEICENGTCQPPRE